MKLRRRNRAGRPLKTGVTRHVECGKIIRADRIRAPDVRAIVIAQRAARGAELGTEADVIHECVLGRLLRDGAITKTLYESGVRFRSIDARYRSIEGLPKPHASAADLDRTNGGLRPNPNDDVVIAVRRAYSEALACLNRAGLAARHEVIRVVVYDEAVFSEDRLIAGLSAMR